MTREKLKRVDKKHTKTRRTIQKLMKEKNTSM